MKIVINANGKEYEYLPKKDITAYELAILLEFFMYAVSEHFETEEEFEKLPDDVKRHFVNQN